jgi:hypothetical protein
MFLLFVLHFFNRNVNSQNQLLDSIITKELLYTHVSALAHDSMQGRRSGTNENIHAGIYIAKQFKEIGLSSIASIGGFGDKVVYNKEFYGYNIIGVLNGKDSMKRDSLVIFSAHYDHIGGSYNGANDNASGTAALMALAKYYTILNNNAYTLLFVAFTGEEFGLVGSKVFVAEMKTKLIKVNINLEMLGRPDGREARPYIYSSLNNNFRKLLNKNLTASNKDNPKNFFIENPYPEQNLERRSDHFSFNQRYVPAFTIMLTAPTDIHYHQVTDELQTLDFDIMYKVVQSIALACNPFLQ